MTAWFIECIQPFLVMTQEQIGSVERQTIQHHAIEVVQLTQPTGEPPWHLESFKLSGALLTMTMNASAHFRIVRFGRRDVCPSDPALQSQPQGEGAFAGACTATDQTQFGARHAVGFIGRACGVKEFRGNRPPSCVSVDRRGTSSK